MWLNLALLLIDHYRCADSVLPSLPYDTAYLLLCSYSDGKHVNKELSLDCYDVISYVYEELDQQITTCPSLGVWWKQVTRDHAESSYSRVSKTLSLVKELDCQWSEMCASEDPVAYLTDRMDVSRVGCILNQDFSELCPKAQSLFRLGTNNSCVELFIVPFDSCGEIPHLSSVLVGFILRSPECVNGFTVQVGDTPIARRGVVYKDKPVRVIDEGFVLMKGCVRLLVESGARFDLVFAATRDF